ncbi:MAG: acyl-CoA/acyl-ACP dehydrogenase [Actinobacteria bacterium]|nr:acyl-CoA/acyl-ACP dehydrogenase [Actinomycetota bacterium]
MDFEFDDDQRELQRSVREVLDNECPPSYVRRIVEDGHDPADLWATLTSLDWPALALDPEVGGLGMTWVEQAIVLEASGHAAAPGPFLATTTQFAPAIREVGSADERLRFLGPVASGERTGTLAVDEGSGTWDPADVEATATADGGGWVLTGTKDFVVDGDTADEVAIALRVGDELRLAVVPGTDLDAEPLDPVDPTTRHARIHLGGVRIDGDRLLGTGDATVAIRRSLEEAATAVALTTVGACQHILDLDLEHVNERHQFGVPIGSFQAVKHKLADMYRDIERARALGYFAALCLAGDDPRRERAASMAKASAGECQRRVVQDGLQLFGGIGYTWEHDLHLFLRRAKVGDLHFGTASHHRRLVARLTLDSAYPV